MKKHRILHRIFVLAIALCITCTLPVSVTVDAAEPYVEIGSYGADVIHVQEMLKQLGYDLAIDGIFGAETDARVREFQTDKGLLVDGVAGQETMAALKECLEVPASAGSSADYSGSSGFNGLLLAGSHGNEVSKVQSILYQLGYLNDAPDGIFGSVTQNAVIRFQQDHGLSADGVVGPDTGGALLAADDPGQTVSPAAPVISDVDPNVCLSFGSSGETVAKLQKMLADLGYYNDSVDGEYGLNTESAVRAFQTANGLYADGIAGPITIRALMNAGSGSDPVPEPEPNPDPDPAPIPVSDEPVGSDEPDELVGSGSSDEAVQLVRAKLNQVGWDLKTAYDWTASLQDPGFDAGNNIHDAARSAFYNSVADSIGKAAAFCLMARELGHSCQVKWGAVPQPDGSYKAHAWTEILVDGTWYVCDPAFQQSTGRNGYMISYGQSGTWKYRIDGNFPE